ncbi:MAG: DNA primase [Oscillospiraceae bacterium]|nr:DNA primase [Oscillospiraceae bacterium]
MPIPESFIRELIDRSDIEDVVGDYVRLDKRSGGNRFGLCPFHGEKTPSFSVNSSRQIYHCFGCGKGGGVISFIMEIENLNYPEAIEFLAKRAGMQVPQEARDPSAKRRERMLALNRSAALFYHEQLSTPAGQAAWDYIARRRLSRATVKNFGLGFAPNTWDSLRKAMHAKGFTDQEMFDAGLLRKGQKDGFYDVFRNRLMFPVVDVRGNVLGFSGRILGEGEPKYMNTPETPVFAKGRNLFALNLAKKTKRPYLILSEGNIDVASLHQAGFDCAVASLGTALTNEQAQLLARFTKQIILIYDNDAAGAKASDRAIEILKKLDLEVKVLRISGAKDPDEYIQQYGAAAFENLLTQAEDQLDYKLRTMQAKYDLSVPEQKVAFVKEAALMLAGLSSAVEREVYARRTAQLCDVRPDVVISDVERTRTALKKRSDKASQRSHSPANAAQPGERDLRYEDPASAVAEEGIITLLYRDPGLAGANRLPSPDEFTSPALAHIFSAMLEKLSLGEEIDANGISGSLTSSEISLFSRLIERPVSDSHRDQALNDYIRKLREEKVNKTQADPLAILAQKRAQQHK